MFNDCLQHVRRMRLVGALTLGVALLALSTAAFAQSSDHSHAWNDSGRQRRVLPSATVTLTNSGTKSARHYRHR